MKVMLMRTTPATMQRTNNGPERKQTTLSFELSQQIRSRCSVSAQLIGSTSNMRTIENILAFQTDPSKWALPRLRRSLSLLHGRKRSLWSFHPRLGTQKLVEYNRTNGNLVLICAVICRGPLTCFVQFGVSLCLCFVLRRWSVALPKYQMNLVKLSCLY